MPLKKSAKTTLRFKMDEARFVVKCFLFAAILLVLSQLKTKSGTIETEIQATLMSSQTANLVNKVADGGAKAVKDFGSYLRTKASATIQAAPSTKEALQEKVETATVDTKKAIQKIETSVKSATHNANQAADDDEVEEIE
jgi:hypothetical protein